MNKAKVDVGQSPPLDLVSAQAEVASNQEQLIVAETAVKQAEDRLRLLIFDPTERDIVERHDRADRRAAGGDASTRTSTPRSRARSRNAPICCGRARTSRTRPSTSKLRRQLSGCPTSASNASYPASGLGGTEVLRTGGFPGTIVGPGTVTGFGSVLDQLFTQQLPDVGGRRQRLVSASARARRRRTTRARSSRRARRQQRVKSAEARVDPAGPRRRLEDRDERAADRDDAGSRASSPSSGWTPSRSGSRSGCRPASW